MKDLNLDKPSENLDYKLVPVVIDGKDAWNVDLLRAPYEDVTICFENVRVNGEEKNISFAFKVVDTDEPSVYNRDNVALQEFASEVLGDILDAAIDSGSLYKKDSNDGHQSTADDSTESTD
tara:strand:+ start:1081 stop:1443 length:363 start_codon:yes stop_codon:yes gene_type:complete